MPPQVNLGDGRTLAYETYGDRDGSPVVLLHGFPASRFHGALLDEPARRLGALVVAPDRPGIGLSTGRLDSLADAAGVVAALADRLEFDRFGLVALSGGAPFALACGARIPDRLTAIALGAGLTPPTLGRAGTALPQRLCMAMAARSPRFALLLCRACREVAVEHTRLFARLAVTQLGRADGRELASMATMESIAGEFVEAFRQGSDSVAHELGHILAPWPFRPEDVRVPVHLEHGACDRTVPLAAAAALAGRLPDARLEVHDGLGHLSLMSERAEALVAAALGDEAAGTAVREPAALASA